MKDKDLKRMSRAELLELLIDKTRENEALHSQLDEALAQLDDRTLKIEKAGTMAEAALLVNGVLDAAQRAGQQYMENMRERCRRMEQETQQRCAELYRTAEQEANRKWDDLFAQLEQLRSENAQLQKTLGERDKKRKWGL